MANGKKPDERKITLPHVLGPNYVAVLADSATVQQRTDEIGGTIQINFSRTDATPRSEEFQAAQVGPNKFRQITQPTFAADDRKIVECAVVMRPDHAMSVAVAILQNLGSLPPQMKTLYRIPDIQKVKAKP
jgi:hypothetical protein